MKGQRSRLLMGGVLLLALAAPAASAAPKSSARELRLMERLERVVAPGHGFFDRVGALLGIGQVPGFAEGLTDSTVVSPTNPSRGPVLRAGDPIVVPPPPPPPSTGGGDDTMGPWPRR